MTHLSRRTALGALAALLGTRAQAHDGIHAEAGWSRAVGAGRVGAGFLTLRNGGSAPDRLVSARAEVAQRVELHTHLHENGVMRMRPVPAIEVPAGGQVMLQPGGFHLMLIDLKQALNRGDRVPVTLVFERAGEVQVTLEVQAAGARGPAAPGGHSRH